MMDTISNALAAAIKAQKRRIKKLRKLRAMVAILDRRRQNIPVTVERREKP